MLSPGGAIETIIFIRKHILHHMKSNVFEEWPEILLQTIFSGDGLLDYGYRQWFVRIG